MKAPAKDPQDVQASTVQSPESGPSGVGSQVVKDSFQTKQSTSQLKHPLEPGKTEKWVWFIRHSHIQMQCQWYQCNQNIMKQNLGNCFDFWFTAFFNAVYYGLKANSAPEGIKTSQELRMLSTVTLYCQVPKVVKNSGSQLLELQTMSKMSQVCRIVLRRNCERTLPHTMSHR